MKREAIEIKVNDQTLWGEIFIPKVSINRAVLFLHGWTGKPNNYAAEVVAKNGYFALTVSFRGHNDSDGDIKTVTVQNSLDDAKATFDFLKTKLPESTPIVLVGSSYGSYIASLLSAVRDVEALSLRVPANYQDEEHDMPKWERGSEVPGIAAWRLTKLGADATASLRAVHKFKGKVQILEAELDDVVPSQGVKNYGEAVADRAQLEYHVMKGWPHSLADNKPRNKEYQTILLEWLNKL